MAKLRLFANLREIAGTSKVDIPGDTVGGVLDVAAERFGPDFRLGLQTARVWINGEATTAEAAVGEEDELVLIPPVSGGSTATPTISAGDLLGFLPLLALIIAVLANTRGPEIWAAALVAIGGAWAMDLGAAFLRRGRRFAPLAVVTSMTAAALATHVLGGGGYGLSVALAVAISLGWAVAEPAYREPAVFAPTLLASLVGSLGVSSLLLARAESAPDPGLADLFLLAAVVGVLAGSVIERIPPVPFLDPFSVTAIGAILGAIVGAVLWDYDVVNYLLVGLGTAVALVAGRGFASMMRSGSISLTEHPPGSMVSLDAIALAAAVLYPLARFVF